MIAEHRPMYLVLLLGTNNTGGAAGGVDGAVNAWQNAANVANAAGVIPRNRHYSAGESKREGKQMRRRQ